MNKIRVLLAMVMTTGLGAVISNAEAEKEIALSQLPAAVTAAAEKAVPGIKLTEAEVYETSEGLMYEVEGTANGKDHELHIAADGTMDDESSEDEDDDDEGDDEDDDKGEKKY